MIKSDLSSVYSCRFLNPPKLIGIVDKIKLVAANKSCSSGSKTAEDWMIADKKSERQGSVGAGASLRPGCARRQICRESKATSGDKLATR